MDKIATKQSRNIVKQAAATRENIRGIHLTFPAPTIIEVLSLLDLDFVYLDGEHGSFDTRDLETACIAAERYDMVPIARVPDRSAATITRFLDRGVRGIIIPHVDSVADAKEALDAVYFSPQGSRSFGGGRPFFTEIDDLPGHLAACNENVSVGIMIESTEGLEAAEAIAALPGVDYFSFGLNDLAQSLGYPGEPNHPEVKRIVEETTQRIRQAGKPVREDFMNLAWINQVLLAGARKLLVQQSTKAY
ncbi:aldolase/citrate lyase family protein [Rhizobium sp. BK376]|uniref:HpcH/HpaI aldolase family protein n=1 Tax=Rhizobium sp. BK376 TaxID=2512149 RepID=UPI001045F8B1|nr:aldolase/citrate lyase family protein [Rhizobium sp. BK376]TCR85958.1 4-hydroxy-2-oxoheptanedioate aldolase [Rhizobium sp. BK376]